MGCCCSILIFAQELREDLNLKVCSHMKVLLISCSISCFEHTLTNMPSDSCADRCQTLKFRLRHVPDTPKMLSQSVSIYTEGHHRHFVVTHSCHIPHHCAQRLLLVNVEKTTPIPSYIHL